MIHETRDNNYGFMDEVVYLLLNDKDPLNIWQGIWSGHPEEKIQTQLLQKTNTKQNIYKLGSQEVH